MKENANKLQPQQIRSVFYASSSIEDILPPELIQHIVSFNHMKPMNIKAVNKTFKTLCDKSENIELKHRENEIKSKIGTTQNNQTWIVHPIRQILTVKEIKLGYKGPMNNLEDTLEQCQSGDTIIIHDGKYILDKFAFPIDKSFQLIGYGKNVILDCSFDDEGGELNLKTSKVYLKNLKLIYMYMNLTNDSTLWMQDCEYRGNSQILVDKNANLYVANCWFKDGSQEVISFTNSTGDLSIVNSMFEVWSGNDYVSESDGIRIEKCIASKIKIIGNKFNINPEYCDAIIAKELIEENKIWMKQFLDNNVHVVGTYKNKWIET
eukprot:205546_1